MERRHQVFLSSSFLDLRETRGAAIRALLAENCVPVGMEFFGADPRLSWDLIRDLIDQSDYYLLLLGEQFGTVFDATAADPRSFTEAEYDYAVRIGKPRIAVFCRSETKNTDTRERRESWARFRAKVKRDNTPDRAYSGSDIKGPVMQGIRNLRDSFPSGGWIKESTFFAQAIETEGAFKSRTAQLLLSARKRAVFSHPPKLAGSAWVFELIPALIACRQRGIEIDVIGDPRGSFRLLEELGCTVVTPPANIAPLSGVLIDPHQSDQCEMICLVRRHQDAPLGAWLGSQFSELIQRARPTTGVAGRKKRAFKLKQLKSIPFEVLEERLRRVPEYRLLKKGDIEVRDVKIDQTRPMLTEISDVKMVQANDLVSLYRSAGLELFEPARILLDGGRSSVLVPPVLEENRKREYRVVEGHTRLLHQRSSGARTVRAVVIRGCSLLPGTRVFDWDQARVVADRTTPPDHNRHARGLETLVHTIPGGGRKPPMEFIDNREIRAAEKRSGRNH